MLGLPRAHALAGIAPTQGLVSRAGVLPISFTQDRVGPHAKSVAGAPRGGPRDNPLRSVTGLPAIVLPAGLTRGGLPIAVEMLGRPFSEPALIRVASASEKGARARRAEDHPAPSRRDVCLLGPAAGIRLQSRILGGLDA